MTINGDLQNVKKEDPDERRKLWKAAIKVPMYTVAVGPIMVGTASAFCAFGTVSIFKFIAFVLCAVGIIAWLNLTNDVFDSDTGIDVNKRESVVNLLGGTRSARNTVLCIANILLLVSLVGLAVICVRSTEHSWKFDFTPLYIILICVFLGYTYQGPPFRLGYYGVGEIICFATWFATVCAAYYTQMPMSSEDSNGLKILLDVVLDPKQLLFYPAFLEALVTALILLGSHFHQLDDDKAAGKKSPIVRLGTQRASYVLVFGLFLLHILPAIATRFSALPRVAATFTFLVVPVSVQATRLVLSKHDKPEEIRMLKFEVVKIHFLYSLAISAGLVLNQSMINR